MRLGRQLKDWEKRLRAYFNTDLSTPAHRRRAMIYTLWFDHEIIRRVWTNFYKVAPGVYRSNQPSRGRLEKMKAMGIRTVLNLRGVTKTAHYLLEKEACEDLGLELVDAQLLARGAAVREDILHVIHLMKTL